MGEDPPSPSPFKKRTHTAHSQRLDDAEYDSPHDGRWWIEWALLPAGTTFSKAATAFLFFTMLYCFVYTVWYISVGGDVCSTERWAADQAYLEVERLRKELRDLQASGVQKAALT